MGTYTYTYTYIHVFHRENYEHGLQQCHNHPYLHTVQVYSEVFSVLAHVHSVLSHPLHRSIYNFVRRLNLYHYRLVWCADIAITDNINVRQCPFKSTYMNTCTNNSLGMARERYLGVGDRGQSLLLEFLNGLLIVSQVKLGAHQDDGSVRTVVAHLRVPLHTMEGNN